jgi:hypothetical protein
MVKHHILIGLGLKKQNFRNRGLQYMLNKNKRGSSIPQNQMTIMPVARPALKIGGAVRRPLKFNY